MTKKGQKRNVIKYDIFTCEDFISSHVRIYRFYQFVTTRYTTDFYIINIVYFCSLPFRFGLRLFTLVCLWSAFIYRCSLLSRLLGVPCFDTDVSGFFFKCELVSIRTT